jgi:hypothetical protein
MCLQFAFLLITRATTWLRQSQREEAWQTAEILILRHRVAVLQRRQPRRPHLNWADRALLAALLSVIPKARRNLREYETHHNQHRRHRALDAAAPLKPLPEPVNLEHYRVRRKAGVAPPLVLIISTAAFLSAAS